MTDMPQHEINEGELPEKKEKSPHSRRWWLWLLAAAFLSIGVYFWLTRDAGMTGQPAVKGVKDKLLAEIDPRPFQAQLTQAEGQMILDQGQLRNAKLDLERYQTLSEQDSIAKQQYDTQKSLVQQLEGAVKVDQGQVENARLQLIYSRITAPIAGRVGLPPGGSGQFHPDNGRKRIGGDYPAPAHHCDFPHP